MASIPHVVLRIGEEILRFDPSSKTVGYRRKAARQNTMQATPAQVEQGENVIHHLTVEDKEAAATLVALGVRTSQDLNLPQDIIDALKILSI